MSMNESDFACYTDKTTDKTSDTGASAMLALEVFTDGVSQGIVDQIRHTAEKPWDTASTLVCGGLTGLFIGATLGKPLGQRLLVAYSFFSTLDIGTRTASAVQKSLETMHHPELYEQNRNAIATGLGKPLFDYGLFTSAGVLSGTAGYYRIARRP